MIGDLARALGQLSDRRFLGVVFKAVVLTLFALAVMVAGLLWAMPEELRLPFIGMVNLDFDWISWAALAVLTFGSAFLMLPVAMLFVGFFLDDVADAVEARHYPHLAPAPRLPVSAALGESFRLIVLLVVANAVALVIYLLSTVLAPVIFWIVNGLLLGREYFQLVAQRRLGRDGANRLRRRNMVEVWMTGVILAVPLSVPVVNLFVPVLGVATFTHQTHRLMRK